MDWAMPQPGTPLSVVYDTDNIVIASNEFGQHICITRDFANGAKLRWIDVPKPHFGTHTKENRNRNTIRNALAKVNIKTWENYCMSWYRKLENMYQSDHDIFQSVLSPIMSMRRAFSEKTHLSAKGRPIEEACIPTLRTLRFHYFFYFQLLQVIACYNHLTNKNFYLISR